jgi:hypothetical protein
MDEAIIGATLGAVGAVVAASISVLARSRVARIEAIARILNDLPKDSPAIEPLQQVLEEDARELRNSQRSVMSFFGVTALIVFVGSVALQVYGVELAAWSSIAHQTIVLVVLVALALLFVMYGLLLYGVVQKAARWIRSWFAARSKRAWPDREREVVAK